MSMTYPANAERTTFKDPSLHTYLSGGLNQFLPFYSRSSKLNEIVSLERGTVDGYNLVKNQVKSRSISILNILAYKTAYNRVRNCF